MRFNNRNQTCASSPCSLREVIIASRRLEVFCVRAGVLGAVALRLCSCNTPQRPHRPLRVSVAGSAALRSENPCMRKGTNKVSSRLVSINNSPCSRVCVESLCGDAWLWSRCLHTAGRWPVFCLCFSLGLLFGFLFFVCSFSFCVCVWLFVGTLEKRGVCI